MTDPALVAKKLAQVEPARGHRGILESSLGATVVGIEAPDGGSNLEIKPYVTADVVTDRTVTPRVAHDPHGDVGFDLKYGITRNVLADVTVNTDFAQVEADEQQINLTRFSLFFPEKRDFFLENQGTFSFGGVPTSGSTAGSGDAPIVFYSRRIGLENGRDVPLRGGGRLTGRIGRTTLGALAIRSGSTTPASGTPTSGATFSVLRLKRDILRKSSVGALFAGRSSSAVRNDAYGADASLGFFANLFIYAYWARTSQSDANRSSSDSSSRVQLDYPGDRYALQVERLEVGDAFNPGVGFVRRPNMLKHYAQAKFRPRTTRVAWVRKFTYVGSWSLIESDSGRVESRAGDLEAGIDFQNSDRLFAGYSASYEFLPRPFAIAPAVTLPVGGYHWSAARAGYNFGRQRSVSGNVQLDVGSFYNGTRTTLAVSQGRVSPFAKLSLEPNVSVNRVRLAQGAFTTTLLGSRVTFTASPTLFLSVLAQYNSGSRTVSTNARLRWEYAPGSELFVVYNEQRDTTTEHFPDLQNRALIRKVNRLFRF